MSSAKVPQIATNSPSGSEPHVSWEDVQDNISGDSHSDSEHQEPLEVVFDGDNLHRRKSSLVEGRRRLEHDATDCFVHSIINQQKKNATKEFSQSELAANRPADKRSAGDREDIHSRLLTKKQLSDMAWGVRELSKKLGGIRLKMHVKNVFLLTKAHDQSLIGKTREIAAWLLSNDREAPYTVYVESNLENNPHFNAKGLLAENPSFEGRLKYWTVKLCQERPHTFDFVVSLGGDGTVLYASWLFQRVVPPVLSFNLGSLGFLTKFEYKNFRDILQGAFRDGITVSLRLRFECTIMRSQNHKRGQPRDLVEEVVGEECDDNRTHKPDGNHEILNDVVVDRGPNPTMSSIEIFGDDEHFTTVQADGVCIATPTGSTAYNLAAGGSLSHPENPVILLTAICAHTLSFRPIILPDTIVLRLGVPYDSRTSSWASFDGRERVELCPGDYVTISASRFPFPNVVPRGRRSQDWIDSISKTLHWNTRQKQKAFKEREDELTEELEKEREKRV
ncbi:MAG: hypothetical protein M1819_000330 [Sarea resinae]|nr:MAG: hypothetical protein M1819_000330 [Sarea resinae]